MSRRKFIRYIAPNLGAILVLVLFMTDKLGAQSRVAVAPQAPTTTVSYQGHLTNASGQPTTGTLPMVFNLYAAPTGGSAVWTESRSGANAVPVANGLFNILLGSVTPIDTNLLNQDLWLGISVDGDAEMTPREKLGSVPYAARAGTVPDGAITSAKQTITTFHQEDGNAVNVQGYTERAVLSTFSLDNVPAGDVNIVVTLTGFVVSGATNGGTVWVEVNGTVVNGVPAHTIGTQWTQLTLHGIRSNFSGGTLVVRVVASSEQAQGNLWFGVQNNGDGRFGRQLTVIAGQ